MAFEYTPYRNPYIGTIADLMARGEDAKAKMLVDVASAQARAAEAKGQIYGNAIQNIGQSASKALSDYTLEKQNAPIRAQEAEMRAMTLAAARDNQQIGRGKEFLASTMNPPDPNYQKDPVTGQSPLPGPPSPDNRDIYKPGPYGSKFMDPNLAQQRLVDAGFGAHLETLMPIVENQNARNSAFVAGKNKARAEYAREVLNVMRAGVPWTQALELVGHSGVENGVFDANDLANLTRQGEGQPPAAQQAILFNIMEQGGAKRTLEAPGQIELLGGIPTGRDTGKKPLTPAEEEALAYATPPAARTPAQQAIIAGVVEKTAAGRAPVAPPAAGSDASKIALELGIFTARNGRPPSNEEQLNIERRVSLEKPTASDPNATLSATLRLADSLKSHPAYVKMLDIDSAYAATQVGTRQNNGVGDITVINALQRMVDPGVSVREGDVALVRGAQPYIDMLRAIPESVTKGSKFSSEMRIAISKLASDLMTARAAGFNESVGDQYKAISSQFGIPYQLVGRDFTVPAGPLKRPK